MFVLAAFYEGLLGQVYIYLSHLLEAREIKKKTDVMRYYTTNTHLASLLVAAILKTKRPWRTSSGRPEEGKQVCIHVTSKKPQAPPAIARAGRSTRLYCTIITRLTGEGSIGQPVYP